MKTFAEILVLFLAEIKIQLKHKSYCTYTGKSKVFNEWLESKSLAGEPISSITNQYIAEFFMYLATERGLDRPTCQKYYITLKRIFKYAHKRDLIDSIPFDAELIVYPRKKEDMSAQVIQKEDLLELTNYISKKDKQLYLATMMEYYCGARPGKEVRLIKAENFNLNDGILRIDSENAKVGRARYITMSNEFIHICKDYGIDKAHPSLYIFGKHKKMGVEAISENVLRYRFNVCRDKLGLSKKIKLYSYKHTSASMLINKKILDMEQLREHLGHSSLLATQKYVKRIGCGINMDIRNSFPSPV